jgi:hypothetical protein
MAWICWELSPRAAVVELDSLELHVHVMSGRTLAWWLFSETGAWLGLASIGLA